MIGYFCLIYIGVHTHAPWLYFVLTGLGLCLKLLTAVIKAVCEDDKL